MTDSASSALTAIDPARVSAEFLARVPLRFARDHTLVSQGVGERGDELVAWGSPERSALGACLAHNLSVRLGRPARLIEAPPEPVVRVIDDLAARAPPHPEHASRDQDEPEPTGLDERDIVAALAAEDRDLLKTAGRAPVVKLVNALLFEALSLRASDVHIQPAPGTFPGAALSSSEGRVVVRYRVDGALFEARTLPRRLLEPIVSRVKVMARMDIAERRLPQDGRASVSIGREQIDLRISSLPTAVGERLVLRLLDKRRSELLDLERLGMPPSVRLAFERICDRPHGMALVTGPTGSGKTTTLYSVLRRVASPDRNVITIEDPIEYELSGWSSRERGEDSGRGGDSGGGGGISQSQVNAKKGVTFATGLRHILRQDPDVIMVGEIRDAETARIAVQAALTGHLVLSTLHTNSAASAVMRLVDLGVEPYLINAALSAVMAQRLVRTVCASCRGEAKDEPCPACRGTGLRGRVGLFELLLIDGRIRELVGAGATAAELERAARGAGLRTLRQAGLDAVTAGIATQAEVDRVTLAEDALEAERSAEGGA